MAQLIGKAPHVTFLSAEDLEREIASAGFEIIEIARHASRGKDARPFVVARKADAPYACWTTEELGEKIIAGCRKSSI